MDTCNRHTSNLFLTLSEVNEPVHEFFKRLHATPRATKSVFENGSDEGRNDEIGE